jgi:hypothetical protein
MRIGDIDRGRVRLAEAEGCISENLTPGGWGSGTTQLFRPAPKKKRCWGISAEPQNQIHLKSVVIHARCLIVELSRRPTRSDSLGVTVTIRCRSFGLFSRRETVFAGRLDVSIDDEIGIGRLRQRTVGCIGRDW